MKIESIPTLVRDGKRLHQIVSTFAKYGLAPWLSNIDVGWVQRHFQSQDGEQIGDMPQEVRLRLALTELGTTFIKLGQILSTRPDLVGPEFTTELAKLQADTPADPADQVCQMIESELGAAPDELFLEFHTEAMASASIGQVHAAKLQDGTDVVVKVQHANIEDKIRSDLDIMRQLAELAEHYSEQARQYRPVDTMEEFSQTLLNELDFTRERRNLERFTTNFEKEPDVVIPEPYGQLSSTRVLTMDRLDGTSLANADKLRASGHDLDQIARRGADIFLEMIFRDGFYHADPHPGNLFVVGDSSIGLLDCGMVGRIDDRLREQFEDLLMAAVDKDTVGLTDSICQLGSVPRELDTDQLRSDVGDFLAEYGTQTLDEFDLGGALNQMMAIIRRFNIILPSRVSLLIKVLVMLEGTARELSPTFNLVEILQPYQSKIMRRRLDPKRLWSKFYRNISDWNRLLEMAPRELADILTQIKRGRFDVHLEHRKLDPVINRMVMGVLTAALFLGSSLILSTNVPPRLGGVSMIGAAGCIVAVFMGYRIVRAVNRSGNMNSK